jgi:hypothetical protein
VSVTEPTGEGVLAAWARTPTDESSFRITLQNQRPAAADCDWPTFAATEPPVLAQEKDLAPDGMPRVPTPAVSVVEAAAAERESASTGSLHAPGRVSTYDLARHVQMPISAFISARPGSVPVVETTRRPLAQTTCHDVAASSSRPTRTATRLAADGVHDVRCGAGAVDVPLTASWDVDMTPVAPVRILDSTVAPFAKAPFTVQESLLVVHWAVPLESRTTNREVPRLLSQRFAVPATRPPLSKVNDHDTEFAVRVVMVGAFGGLRLNNVV